MITASMLDSPRRWTVSALLCAVTLALGLSWCVLKSPLTRADSLSEILNARRASSVVAVFMNALDSPGYFRPLRVAQLKAVYDLAPRNPTLAYQALHVALLGATLVLFVAFLRPGTAAEFTAAVIALMVLAGHHAFFILIAEMYPINHFLELLAFMLAAAALARGRPRWWKGALAVVLVAVGMPILESSLLIVAVVTTGWLVGWRGIPGRGVIVCVALLAAYFWIRFGLLQVAAPSLDERSAGWMTGRLEPDQLVLRFGDNPLPFYVYNVVSALLDLLVSQPRDGTWVMIQRWEEGSLRPWAAIHLLSSVLLSGALLAALAGAVRRWRRGALEEVDRFVLLAAAIVGGNAALSYAYVKDEALSAGAAFYAAAAFAVLASMVSRVRSARSLPVAAAVLLLSLSVLWSTRAAGTFFSLRAFAFKTASDWGSYSLERELPADWAWSPNRQLFFELRRVNVTRDVPAPTFTNEREVQRFVEIK